MNRLISSVNIFDEVNFQVEPLKQLARMPVPKFVCEVSHVSGFASFTDGNMLGT